MTAIPMHFRPFDSTDLGRYKRASKKAAPRCPQCDTAYRAASTRPVVTWYRPRCQCAPPGMIKRMRKLKPELQDTPTAGASTATRTPVP